VIESLMDLGNVDQRDALRALPVPLLSIVGGADAILDPRCDFGNLRMNGGMKDHVVPRWRLHMAVRRVRPTASRESSC
jgi:hypothetical protein